jgi:hypothetical protein
VVQVEASPEVITGLTDAIFGENFLLTPGQTEEMLGVPYTRLTKMVNEGDLVAYGAGKRNMFKLRHVLRITLGEDSLTEEEKKEILGE